MAALGREKRFFSVVIPLYNKEKSIKIALNSVLSQTHDNFEVVVIDDGSTDASASVVAAVRDDRVRLIRQSNGGVSVARNAGVRHARSDYIAFIDADDCWQPDFLESIDRLIDLNPDAGLFATAYKREEKDGRIVTLKLEPSIASMPPGEIKRFFQVAAFGDEPFHPAGVCISRKAFDDVGGFKPGVKYGEDLDVFARLALRYPVMFTPQPKVLYRCTAENRALSRALPLAPWVFRDEARQLSASGKLAPELADDLIEYAAKVDLYTAFTNLLSLDRGAVLAFLGGIETKAFARKKLLMSLLLYLPLPLRKIVIAMHGKVNLRWLKR